MQSAVLYLHFVVVRSCSFLHSLRLMGDTEDMTYSGDNLYFTVFPKKGHIKALKCVFVYLFVCVK